MWWNTRHSSMTYASPSSSGFSGSTSMATLRPSSTNSWESRPAATPAWRHLNRKLGGWWKSSMVSSSIISSDETMKRSMPSPDSGRPGNCPLRECSHMTFSSPPFSLSRMSRHSHQEHHWVRIVQYLCRGTAEVPVPIGWPGSYRLYRLVDDETIGQDWEPGGEIAAIVRTSGVDADWPVVPGQWAVSGHPGPSPTKLAPSR
jgi:hypothetical protein